MIIESIYYWILYIDNTTIFLLQIFFKILIVNLILIYTKKFKLIDLLFIFLLNIIFLSN